MKTFGKMKALGLVVAVAGILTLFLSSALNYRAAHLKAQSFLAAHPELQGVSFVVVENGFQGHLILDGRTLQPAAGHYVLEFDKMGVIETSDAVPTVISSGYLDLTRVPGWAIMISLAMCAGGGTLIILSGKKVQTVP
jgi:hypothetical protein